MGTTSEEDDRAIAMARQYLEDYPLLNEPYRSFSPKEQHLNPKILLKAALDFAPSDAGRINVAKSIVNADENTSNQSRNARLEAMANEVFMDLLVPCKTRNVSSLTVVQARGGRTRPVSERSSRSSPPSGYEINPDEFQTVTRRKGNRKMVFTLGPKLINITDLAAIRLYLSNDQYQRQQLSKPQTR